MINLKHIGIYTNNIKHLSDFYKECFNMIPICENKEDTGLLYEALFGVPSKVLITKLITEYGNTTGQGEMIELIQITEGVQADICRRKVQDVGLSHFSLGVIGIENTVSSIVDKKGNQITPIVKLGERKCCFCSDPDGNVIELIE